jgi:hypothetical protein
MQSALTPGLSRGDNRGIVMKLALIFLCAVVLLAPGCATDSYDTSKWDYAIVNATDPYKVQKFNQLASEGWQLVETDPYKGTLWRRAKP